MRKTLYLVFFLILHALCLFQPVLSLPLKVTLERRVRHEDLRPQRYPGFKPGGRPTFYHKETFDHNLSPAEVNAAAEHAYNLIRDHHLGNDKDLNYPDNMIVAALYVPHQRAIHYASQPLGAGSVHFRNLKTAGRWPHPLNEQGIMHAEGHAVFQAMDDKARLKGSYIAVHGHFDKGNGHSLSPCHGGGRSNGLTNCSALLGHLKINTKHNPNAHHP